MLFKNVQLKTATLITPPRVATSLEIEARLAPVYRRLRLIPGRLELMTGIRERKFWLPQTRPSTVAAQAGKLALEHTGFDPQKIGCLIHASVCRDFLEPATASIVHEILGLPETCAAFDLSNACLGVLNAMAQIATMIDAGQIDAGLAVSGEVAEPLHEATLTSLLADRRLDKRRLKNQFASLTIGSAAAAVLLCRDDGTHTPTSPKLLGGSLGTDSKANLLCQADPSDATPDGPLMNTDSEGLLHAGVALAARTWERAKAELNWGNETPRHVFTHQVGKAHAKLTFDTLGLDQARDFPTVSFMGNTGSAALPGALALGLQDKRFEKGDTTALLGIGSGLSCLMLGLEH